MKEVAKMTFAEKIKTLRINKGIGLNELAHRVGISPSYLSELERGIKPAPLGEILVRLAEELGCTTEELVWLATQERAPQKIKDSFVKEIEIMFRGMGSLPEEDRREILNFYEFMKQKHKKKEQESGTSE